MNFETQDFVTGFEIQLLPTHWAIKALHKGGRSLFLYNRTKYEWTLSSFGLSATVRYDQHGVEIWFHDDQKRNRFKNNHQLLKIRHKNNVYAVWRIDYDDNFTPPLQYHVYKSFIMTF